MAERCPDCGANLAFVGKLHRCVPKAVPQSSTVANNTAANNTVANTGVTNKAPRWATWRSRNPDLYRQRQRDLMRQRRARNAPP
jgi:hypothetical protein